jgi:HEAT repeat protein
MFRSWSASVRGGFLGALLVLGCCTSVIVGSESPPGSPATDANDEALLQQRLTVSWGTSQICDVLKDLQLALPPGSIFRFSPIAYESYSWTAPAHFEAVRLRDILDALAKPPLTWHLEQGDLTIAYSGNGGEAERKQGFTLDQLRHLIRAWTQAGLEETVNEDHLDAVFQHITNFYNMFLPIPALEDDQELRRAVQTQILNLVPRSHLPARAIAIAGYLRLAACSQGFLARLEHAHPIDAEEETTEEMIAGQDEVEALETALGWMRYRPAVPVLARLAERPCRWHIDGVADEDLEMATEGGSRNMLGFAYIRFVVQRNDAITALGRIHDPTALEALETVLRDIRPYAARGPAARALALAGSMESLPLIRAAMHLGLAGKRSEHWTGAVDGEIAAESWALGRLAGAQGVQELLRLLEQVTLRPSLLSALSDLRDPAIAPALLEMLMHDQDLASGLDETLKHGHEPDVFLRRALADQPGADELLITALSKPGALTQSWGHAAVTVLGETRTPRAASWLATTLHATSSGQPEYTLLIDALAWTFQPEALATLQQLLQRSPEVVVRQDIVHRQLGGCCNVLSQLNHRDELGSTLVWSILHDPSPLVRALAVREDARNLTAQRLSDWATAVLSEADPDVAKQLVATIVQGVDSPLVDAHSRDLGVAALIQVSGAAQADARLAVQAWEQRLPPGAGSAHLKADITRWEGEPASPEAGSRITSALDAFGSTIPP